MKDFKENPLDQFRQWHEEAQLAVTNGQVPVSLQQPYAMTLSTVSSEGIPSSRIVLLKEVDSKGFVFFTNYKSKKAQEIQNQPQVALAFHWGFPDGERQVRVQGTAEKISPEESNAYWKTRPRDSQLGAWASQQSQVILNREVLVNAWKEFEKKYEGKEIPRPDHWGGYRVSPKMIEFWIGRASRLHDRIRYLYNRENWQRDLLSP